MYFMVEIKGANLMEDLSYEQQKESLLTQILLHVSDTARIRSYNESRSFNTCFHHECWRVTQILPTLAVKDPYREVNL